MAEINQTKMQIHVPHEEVSTITRLEMKQQDFFTKLRHYDDDAKFELVVEEPRGLTLKVSTNVFNAIICRGKACVLGVYGFFKDSPDATDDKKDSIAHHWTWPWAKIPQFQTEIKESETLVLRYSSKKDLEQEIRSSKRETMQQLMKAEHVFLSDPVVITYIQAVLHEEMKLDFIYNVPLGDDAFISFGVTELTWTTDEEFINMNSIESDIVTTSIDDVDD